MTFAQLKYPKSAKGTRLRIVAGQRKIRSSPCSRVGADSSFFTLFSFFGHIERSSVVPSPIINQSSLGSINRGATPSEQT